MSIKMWETCPGVAQWVGHCPANRNVASSIPHQATAWVAGQVPGWGCVRGNQVMFLCHIDVFSLLSPLPKNK